jgi:serine/threonine-protein kinase
MPDKLHATLQAQLGTTFVVERELGGGGMSRVFVAREPALKREVVVKVLPPDLRSTLSVARFRREVELTAQIQHPNILPVITTGGSDALLYYVAPYVAGGSLRDLLESGRELPFADAMRIVMELLAALEFAHDRGIVHRDIKPDNVLLSSGHAILADFGIARVLEAVADEGTATSVAQPPEYRAPERPRDHAADLYALAALAFQLLTRQLPKNGQSESSIAALLLDRHAAVGGERLRLVAATLARALAGDPANRFQSAHDIHAALARLDVAPPSRWYRNTTLAAAAVAAIAVPYFMLRAEKETLPPVAAAPAIVRQMADTARGIETPVPAPAPEKEPSRHEETTPVVAPPPNVLAPLDSARRLLDANDREGGVSVLQSIERGSPGYGAARLALAANSAWSGIPVTTERATMLAIEALAAGGISSRDSIVARGIIHLGRAEFPAACAVFDSALAMRSDYSGWMGAGECRIRDSLVLVDSAGGARFRSSLYVAAKSFVEATRHARLWEGPVAIRQLRSVAFVDPARARVGKSPDGRTFLGAQVAAGDSFTVQIASAAERITPAMVTSNERAVAIAREMIKPVLSNWTARDPGNIAVRINYVELLEVMGHIREPGTDGKTALTEVRELRRVATDSSFRGGLALAHVRLLLRARDFHAAGMVADSVLAANPDPDMVTANALVPLAFLTGHAAQAKALLEKVSGLPSRLVRLPQGRTFDIPPSVVRERAQFIVGGTLGLCNDSVRSAPARLLQAVEAVYPNGVRPHGVEAAFIERPLALATPCFSPAEASTYLPEPSNPIYAALFSPKTPPGSGVIPSGANVRTFVLPENILLEAFIMLRRDDTTAARAAIRRLSDALPVMSNAFVNTEIMAGAFTRALLLGAELAAAQKDASEAAEYASAVAELWGSADASLQPTVARMRALRTAPR